MPHMMARPRTADHPTNYKCLTLVLKPEISVAKTSHFWKCKLSIFFLVLLGVEPRIFTLSYNSSL